MSRQKERTRGARALGRHLAAGLLVSALVLLGIAQLGAGQTAPRSLVIIQGGDPAHLDPHMSTSSTEITVTFNIFDTLTFRDEHLNLKPGLATSWVRAGDTTWRFRLRRDARFHNGQPFTADDVKFSLERASNPDRRTVVFPALSVIERVDVLAPYTVNVVTRAPDPLLPVRLSYYGGQIIPRRYFEEVGEREFATRPVGTGPVKVVEWVKGERLALAAHADYWGGRIPFDAVVFRPLPEVASRVGAVTTGQADIAVFVPPDQISVVERSGAARVLGAYFSGFYVFVINVRVPPLDNKLIRQAMHYAINRETIVRTLWRGRGVIPNDAYPRTAKSGYDPQAKFFEFNPRRARELLSQAGYRGQEIVLETAVGLILNDKPLTEAVAAMLQEVGINAKVELLEVAVRAAKLRARTFKGLFLGNPTDTLADPDGMHWRLIQPGGIYDYWRHPEWDRLMTEARFQFQPRLRTQMYRKAAEIFMDEVPWLILLQPENLYAVHNRVKWQPRADELILVREITPAR